MLFDGLPLEIQIYDLKDFMGVMIIVEDLRKVYDPWFCVCFMTIWQVAVRLSRSIEIIYTTLRKSV